MKPTIKFNLIENASDSLRQVINALAWKEIGSEHGRLKYAIVNCFHCIELLLKEKLRQIDPVQIWSNLDQSPNLESHTVNVSTAIKRLGDTGKVTISEKDKVNIKSLGKTRNAIEHYEWKATEKEAKTIIGHALSFAFSFAKDELNIDLSTEFKRDDTWKTFIEELYDFALSHGNRIEMKLRKNGIYPHCCDSCEQLTVPASGGSCELCGHWQSIND